MLHKLILIFSVASALLLGITWFKGNDDGFLHSARAQASLASATDPLTDSQIETEDLTGYEINNIKIYQDVSPSVVFVTNKKLRRNIFSLNVMETPQGSGTGFIWSSDGLIVTNYHVVHGANKIVITLTSGEDFEAKVIGTAPEKDVALLKIEAPSKFLKPIPLGNSNLLSVGRKVLAIGNPFALDTTLTVGVVSALGREIKSISNRTIKNVIQTDAAINPGNSGGPLLDSRGRLVGVNTAIYSPSGGSAGIGFAIPINAIKTIVPQLVEHGKLYRPVIGIDPLPDRFALRLGIKGVAVFSVNEGLPADRVGMIGVREDRRGNIHLGDVIIAINNESVINEDTLLSILENYHPGDTVNVTTLRDDEIFHYEVILAAPD